MKTSKRIRFASIAAFLVLIGVPSAAFAAELTASLDPTTVAVGEAARLNVTVEGQTAQPPSVPDIPGLDISPTGSSSRVTIVNGMVNSSVSYSYLVTPTQQGTFQIAGIHQGAAKAGALTLTVDNAAAAAGRARSSASTSAPAPTPAPAPKKLRKSDLAFLRLDIPDKKLYAGQSVPITVRGYFRGGIGVTLTGPPSIDTDAFTITGLDSEPAQSQTKIKGRDFLKVTWKGLLTAVKSGSHELAVTLPATVQYREAVQRPQRRRTSSWQSRQRALFDQMMKGAFDDDQFDKLASAMFDDPFFDDSGFEPVFGKVLTRDLDLTTRKATTTVAPLPAAGRPADFGGAVGTFDVAATLDHSQLVAGEPATLDVTVSGSGNFASVRGATLAEAAGWKAYTPHATFEPKNALGFEGKKTFEQAVTASDAGQTALPEVSFSYFDPDLEKYVTKTAPPIAVTVAEGETAKPVNAGAVLDLREPHPDAGPSFRDAVGPGVSTLARGGVPASIPLTALGLLLGALLSAISLRVGRSEWWSEHARRRTWRRAARRSRKQMSKAAASSDADAFFASARRAIQYRLAVVWDVTPESITTREVSSRWPDAPADVLQVFRLADASEFSNATPSNQNLDDWAKRVDAVLGALPRPPRRDDTSIPAAKVSS